MAERERIGTYTLTEPKVFRQGYETAAWWTTIEVPAGEYEAYLTRNPEGWPQFVIVPMDGVIVDEYLPSLFGGVPTGGLPTPRTGAPARYAIQTYPFMVERAPSDGDGIWDVTITYPNGTAKTRKPGLKGEDVRTEGD